jgi:hypothetical protein
MAKVPLPDQISLHDLLGNLSAELRGLASTALDIEDKVGDVIADGMRGGDRLVVSLQGLDHLAQTANELAAFVGSIAGSVDRSIAIPVAEHVQSIGLRSLAEALVGHGASKSALLTSRGDVDLF